jgi:hypothetical protein
VQIIETIDSMEEVVQKEKENAWLESADLKLKVIDKQIKNKIAWLKSLKNTLWLDGKNTQIILNQNKISLNSNDLSSI